MSNKKAEELIPLIINASDRQSAISVLNKTLESLYLTNDYVNIVHLKDRLQEYQAEYQGIVDTYKELGEVKAYAELHSIRTDLNFLYREVTDNLVFDINRLKIYYEEYKTIQRSRSMESLKENEDFQQKFKAKSTSALRDAVGADKEYNEYVTATSISYGLYQNLQTMLNSIRQMIDSVASEESFLRIIENKDVK